MKRIVVASVCMIFALMGVGFAQTPPPVAGPTPVMVAHREHHPEIHRAMRKLRGAKDDLEKATHDYGGHRVRAIEAIDHAMQELREALESDK